MDEDTHVHSSEDNHSHDEPNKSNTMLWVGVAVIALLLVGGIVMSQRSSNNTDEAMMAEDPGTSMMVEEDQTAEDGADADDESESVIVDVEGGMFYFEPNEIRVKKGEMVTIVFNSVEGMHDFVIDELDIRTPIIEAGETSEVEFVAEEAGEYEFYCSVGEHRQQGMVGTLIVEE